MFDLVIATRKAFEVKNLEINLEMLQLHLSVYIHYKGIFSIGKRAFVRPYLWTIEALPLLLFSLIKFLIIGYS